MFLKSLTLKGFKSFADATTLELEPGVTVVVGPNGSGKSNVVDAIAWVLGAQAPSAVRSQKMDDVIFAGTASRPALGRAEVSLTIDNSSGLLGLDVSEVSISRILFRTGESEYSINGVPCRLLDVQELLSDAGVGRQQHVIVSQGQIDAVLNARPEERRGIIEEAAGVLKYRKRKEKAERRLDATEANLLRVQDLLREVRRQLRPLERQADAARRHGDLVTELDALRIYTTGREIAGLRTRLETLAATRSDAADRERDLKSTLATLDTEVIRIESELSARGIADLGDQLVRIESLRVRARGIAALIAERRRSFERDRGRMIDEGLVANLEADVAGLRTELASVDTELAGLDPDVAALDADEHTLVVDRAAVAAGTERASGEEAARAAAEVRGELRSVRQTAERTRSDLARVDDRIATLDRHLAASSEAMAELTAECDDCRSLELPLIDELSATTATVASLDDEMRTMTERHQEAIADVARTSARAEALEQALDSVRSQAGADHLRGVDGALGTLLDLIEIDPGWETAVESALGESVAAVVVSDAAAARRAIERLSDRSTSGAVLAIPSRPFTATPPSRGQAVRPHVRSTVAEVARLLDALLGEAVLVDGHDDAIDIAIDHPGAIVVTRRGDRFSRRGWRVGSAGLAATAAALDEARLRAAAASATLAAVVSDRSGLERRLDDARRRVVDLQFRLDQLGARLTAATEALTTAQNQHRGLDLERDGQRAQATGLSELLRSEQARIDQLESLLPALEAEENEHAEIRAALDARESVIASRRRDLDVRRAGLLERQAFLARRIADIDERLRADHEARTEAGARRRRIESDIARLDELGERLETRRMWIDREHARLTELRRQQNEAVRTLSSRLDALRHERHEAERSLEELRERARRAEIDEAETALRLETAIETLRRDLDIEPEVAEAAPQPDVPEGVTAAARIRELERELRLMGPINPLALEEFTELRTRHDFLEEQLQDVRETRRELSRVIRAIDAEIQSVFAGAFADVSANFTHLFSTLFPGGSGRLILTSPDDLLNTGVEVEAKPSGKNIKKLSLLSGGERSLTALAFLFAVFRSRPSPFYVMDEVEAALDDVNLHRFLGLVAEFRSEAQLLIVSHQKRTMEAGDSLLGVSMQPGGSSKVVTERVGVSS